MHFDGTHLLGNVLARALYPVSYTHLDVYKRQIFDDAEAWGVDTLKGWIDDYVMYRE